MIEFIVIFSPFLILHILSWTSLPEKMPVRRKVLGTKNGGTVTGRSSLFWVWVDPRAELHTIKHEQKHLRDKWMLCWIGYLLFGMTKAGKKWREKRGYAVSVKYGRDIDSAARGMAAGVKISFEEAKSLIQSQLT